MPLDAQRGDGPPGVFRLQTRTPTAATAPLTEQDSERIARAIASAVRGGARKPADFLVLFRTRKQMSDYARALEARGIPYELSGGGAFEDSEELRTLLPLLRTISDPDDPVPFVSVLRGPLFGVDDEALYRLLARRRPVLVPGDPAGGRRSRGSSGPASSCARARSWRRRCRRRPRSRGSAATSAGPRYAAARELGDSRAGNLLKAIAAARTFSAEGLDFAAVVAELDRLARRGIHRGDERPAGTPRRRAPDDRPRRQGARGAGRVPRRSPAGIKPADALLDRPQRTERPGALARHPRARERLQRHRDRRAARLGRDVPARRGLRERREGAAALRRRDPRQGDARRERLEAGQERERAGRVGRRSLRTSRRTFPRRRSRRPPGPSRRSRGFRPSARPSCGGGGQRREASARPTYAVASVTRVAHTGPAPDVGADGPRHVLGPRAPPPSRGVDARRRRSTCAPTPRTCSPRRSVPPETSTRSCARWRACARRRSGSGRAPRGDASSKCRSPSPCPGRNSASPTGPSSRSCRAPSTSSSRKTTAGCSSTTSPTRSADNLDALVAFYDAADHDLPQVLGAPDRQAHRAGLFFIQNGREVWPGTPSPRLT